VRETDGCWVDILRCADGAFYTGSTRKTIEARLAEHQSAHHQEAFTATRLPVVLVFAEHFPVITDAIAMERRTKGWSRAKKEALIAQNFQQLVLLSKRGYRPAAPVLRDAADAAPQDEGC
jgi:putative endonuclease